MKGCDVEEDADQELSNYRKKLVRLDNELDSDNIKCLKYLCFDVIPVSKLEKISQGTDLLELLEQRGCLGNGNYFFLAECLNKICRRDLSQFLLADNVLDAAIQTAGSRIPAHRTLWFDIGEDIDDEEVRKCLYYYGDVPKSKIGGIQTGIDFLSFLEKMKKISPDNMDYLIEVLNTIDRDDLVKIIRKHRGQSSGHFPYIPIHRPPPPSVAGQLFDDELDSFKARVKERMLSDDFDAWKEKEREINPVDDDDMWVEPEKERESVDFTSKSIDPQTSSPEIPMPMQINLAYEICKEPGRDREFGKALGLSTDEIGRIITNNSKRPDMKPLEMMRLWSQKTLADGENKVNEFVSALMKIGFGDQSVKLKALLFRRDDGAVTEPNVNNPEPQETIPELPGNVGSISNVVPSHRDEHENLYVRSGEARLLNPGEDDINVRQMNEAIAEVIPPPSTPLLETYRMDRSPRGMCVIFNNENFTYDPLDRQAKRMNDRVGSSIDRNVLENTFTELGFIVDVHNNVKAVDMVRILTSCSLEDHNQFDCFVCVILSHGTRDHIYGSNGVPVAIRDLAGPLKNISCPGLCGKPKLFFIQACQGQDKQQGRDIERDAVRVDDLDEDAPTSGEVIPNEQDFLIGMATIPGFVSYRSKTSGSWYIIKLCEALKQYAKYWDILHILTYVNSEVGKANADIDGDRYKQSPGPLYTLRKRLVFQPFVTSSDHSQ